MELNKSNIKIFIDEDETPIGEFTPPVKFQFDTTKLTDGTHTLKIVAKSTNGVEGIKTIPFEVRNGPSIAVIGLNNHDVVDDKIPLTINAYGSERKDMFMVTGSENPKGVPSWIWPILIGFIGWGLFYLIMYWVQDNYTSFF